MKKAIFSLVLLSAFVMSCNGQKKEDRLGLINTLPQEVIDENATVTKELSSVDLTYADNTRVFSNKNLTIPCDDKQLAVLKSSEEKLTILENKLLSRENLFRESALDTFRDIRSKKESLININASIQGYCQHEHKALSACFESSAPIVVHINRFMSGYLIVHPIVVLEEKKSVGLFTLTLPDKGEEQDYVRSIDIKDGSTLKHPSTVLTSLVTVKKLETTLECVNKSEPKTEIAQKVKSTVLTSLTLARRDCLIIKGNLLAAKKKEAELGENVQVQIEVTDEQKWSCGELLN